MPMSCIKNHVQKKMSIKQFQCDISREFISKTLVKKRRMILHSSASSISPVRIEKGKLTFPSIRMEQSAYQTTSSTSKVCTLCSTKANEIRTNFKCSICDVSLFLGKNKTCFVEYHRLG